MPCTLFDEWMEYYALEPFGEQRADWRQAWTSLLIDLYFGGNKNAKLSNYMWESGTGGGKKKKVKSPEELTQFFQAITIGAGGRFINPNGND